MRFTIGGIQQAKKSKMTIPIVLETRFSIALSLTTADNPGKAGAMVVDLILQRIVPYEASMIVKLKSGIAIKRVQIALSTLIQARCNTELKVERTPKTFQAMPNVLARLHRWKNDIIICAAYKG
ncbi:hypothetical protein AC249_AIPGENE4208 [Exaiptasia diaphana]|nr:hypothetical protein AC249_AIPGENE4208 [Exaiptasia diaphana]